MSKDESVLSLAGRVLYVQNEYPVQSQTFVSNEVEGVQSAGLEVAVISCRVASGPPPESVPHLSLNNVSFFRVLGAHPRLLRGRPLTYLRYLRECIGTGLAAAPWFLYLPYLSVHHQVEEAVHIHTHFATRASAFAGIVSRVFTIGRSVTVHAADIYTRNKSIEPQLRGAKIATVTQYNQTYLRALGYPESELIRCGVGPSQGSLSSGELSLLRAIRARAESEGALVVSVGRLVEKKGHGNLIRAMSKVDMEDREPFVVIVGDGPLRSELEETARKLGVNVEFLGGQSNQFIRALLREANVFVLACVSEPSGDADGLPVAILEAAFEGCPVVAGNVTGVSEFVDSETGWLVDGGSEEEIYHAVTEALNEKALRERRVSAARERVLREFSIEQQVADVSRLFWLGQLR
jgi:colanic acid/amylovoran biosynthesis glycosyltransferase